MTEDVDTLVVGAGGLLGAAVVRQLRREGRASRSASVSWDDVDTAAAALLDQARALVEQDRPWQILWCAGAGVIGTSEEALDEELEVLERFLSGLARVLARTWTPPNGALFLSSSAGGVYAGSAGALFTESTEPVATSPYGHAKLASERIVTDFAAASGVPTMIGRMSNLYGPGQDLDKPQGLISQLFLAQRQRRPLSIYVSLDTARDYLYVDDAARILLAATDRVADGTPGATVVKILASQRSVTIGSILGELRHLVRRRPLIVLGSSHLSRFQAGHLRFRSEVWPDLDSLATTPLPAGMSATMAGVAREAG